MPATLSAIAPLLAGTATPDALLLHAAQIVAPSAILVPHALQKAIICLPLFVFACGGLGYTHISNSRLKADAR